MGQPSVFLSHSSKDANFTAKLEADLRTSGATIHLVRPDQPGDFQQRINAALAACEYVVLVLTKDAIGSKWVEQEIHAAIRLKNQGSIKDIILVQARKLNQRDIPPLWGVYNIFDATRDYTSARDGVVRALSLVPGRAAPPAAQTAKPGESADELRDRAFSLFAADNYAEAIPLYERATQLDPRHEHGWASLGIAYEHAGRYQEALAAYERAVTLRPNQDGFWQGKASVLRKLGRHQEALAAIDHALSIHQDWSTSWTTRGDILQALGRLQDALAAYDRALALDRLDFSARSGKDEVLKKLGRSR